MARTKQTARKLGKGVRQVVQQQQMARSLFDNDDEDEERDYEQAENEAEMEEENDAMDEIFNFDDNPSYEGDSLVINWSSIMFNNQFMFSLAKQPSSAFLKAKRMNFTGLESACDFLFYQLGRLLKTSQSESSKTASEGNLDIDGIVLNGCKNVNIWSLHYLYQAVDKSIFDLSSSSVPLKERVAGCDLIGETLCLWFSQELGTQLKEELGIVSESKVLIMNEANQEPFLADFLVNNRSNKTTNKLFKHAKLEIDQSRSLNLIEFNQDFSGLFLTEPNLIVVPFQMDKPDDAIVNSVFNRLILAMTKTVITTNVLILGIGKPIPNKIENLKKSISAYLKKLQSALQKTIDANLDKKKKSELSTVSDFNYEFQVYLSQIVNLIEQINLIDRLLRYQVVDFEQKSNKKEEKKAAKKVEENNGDQNNYELIGAVEDVFVAYNNVSEITSLSYPHSWVNMVGEAMCLIAARKPNFANFKSLLNEPSFLNTYISSYNAKNMSDYVHNELKIYVDNPNFVPDKIREVSKTAGAICKWILVSFDIASKNKEQSGLTSIPDMLEKQALIDRLDKYSLTCYSFAQYYDDMLKEKPPTDTNSDPFFVNASITQENRQRFREMCDRVKEIDFKKTKFHSYEDFSKLFKGNDELVGKMTNRFFDFPNKFLKSNCAQGNFHFIDSEKSKFIVTDLNWLSTIVDAISTDPKSNKDDRELRKILGKNVPIWKKDTLREHLKPLIDENKFEDLLDYLDRHNLILRDNDGELIVPINMLTDFQNVQIEEFWPKIWDGLEFGLKWNLFNILPKNSFNKMLKKFFDLSSSKTKLLWNNGFINEECGCVVLAIYTDFEVTLRMRVLDGEKILNIPRNRINNVAKSVFMDYYLAIQEIFIKSKIAFKINFVDKFNHPCVDKPSDSLDDEAIFKLDRSFFANKLQFKHDFKFKSGSESCSRCYVESGAQYETASLVARIYRNFKFDYFATKVENSGEKKTKHSLIEVDSKRDQTIKSVYSFNSEHYRRFQCDFIEKSYEFCIVNLVLDIFNGTSTVLIDLNRRTHTVYSSGDKGSIQLKNTTLFAKNSPEDKDKTICTIKQGDRVWVELRDFTSKSVYVSINYNLEEIAGYVVILNGKTLSIRPEIKIEAVEGKTKGGTKKKSRLMLSTDSVSIQSVADYFARTDECNNQLNPKAKEKELIDYVKTNYLSICENMKTYMNSLENGVRGFTILPRTIDVLDQSNLNYLHQNLDLHMFCLNCHNFTRIQKSFLYCHLIDMKGLPLKKDAIDMKTVLFIALSSFMISNAENSIILPKCEEIFENFKPDDKNKSKKHLGKKLRKYFFKIFQTLIIYFDLEELKSNLIDVEMKNLMSSLSQDDLRKDQYEIVGKCAFCQKCDFSYYTPVTLQEKLTNQYANCLMILGIRHNYGDRDKPEDGLTINDEFVEKFNEIKYLGVIDRPLTIKQPEEIFNKLKCLTLIDFSNNNIEEIPDSLLQTNSLLSLTIENNPIKSLKSASFKQLRHLKNLELTNLSLNRDRLSLSGAELIVLPSRLESFDFSRMTFDSIPFDFGECKTSLTKLNFSGVRWPLVEEYGGVNAMITHDQIAKAYCNLMNENELAKVFRYFDTNGAAMKGVLQRKEMLKLAAFVFKRFARLRPTQASPSGVPDVIFELKNLTVLNLSFQGIKFIPDTIENLTKLRVLTLDNCILLESISPRIGNLPLEELSLSNCLSLKTPPPEIVRRGKTSVMAYLKRLSTGSVTCKRTKLMLVGLGEAGKTSLVNSLVESASKAMKKPEITDGIVIKDWTIPLPDQTNLTYSIWDFAGQSVYYNSHQFFLSSRAVYFLVWNVRLGSEYAGLDFWLSSISCHAPGAPIFVVGTHIDEVSKYTLNQEKLKSKYNQIVAFYFISNKTKAGINELVNRLIDTTLREKYMGEAIPEVWLNFEKEIKIEGERRSLMNYDEVKASAEKSGIYDEQEVLQAVRFLSDLGSLQYFENNGLKDKVVINPQWIVDVISCVVSVKESPIKDGKLYHKDIPVIWKRFDASLYDWILKLTEEFDLTYLLEIDDSKRVEDNNGQMSIVPCMLPDDELNLDWTDINEYSIDREVKEFRVLYSFAYLPAGLFNRIQVRLFQYADKSSIWKNGSLLRKNKNKALIKTNIEAGTIDVRVQGRKPDNVVFLIHEVIETLINESFNGLQYDFSFSCPECVDFQSSHPALFSSSILRRAYELKAPFLQCSERFHAISIQEMLNIMPIEGLSNIDTNLERSLGDLKQMRRALKHDIFIWYCEKDTKASAANCNPLELIEAIRKERYDIWSPSKPAEEKMDRVTVAIKESRMAILAISDEFANDERCLQVFELVKNIIKKPYLIVEFGTIGAHKWLENSQFVSVCSEFRIIMQDRKRYAAKLVETLDAVERHLSEIKIDKTVLEIRPDVFISYCWSNSHDAVKKGTKGAPTSLGWFDPRALAKLFEENEIRTWLDVTEVGSATNTSLFSDITKGMNAASVVIACFSDEYALSKNCVLEFRFAHVSLKLPIVKAVVGTGDEWRRNEIAFLAGSYPEVNLQYENPTGLKRLVELVKDELREKKKSESAAAVNKTANQLETESQEADSTNSAYQEIYELTQRKFLKQLTKYSSKMQQSREHPRLLCIDLINAQRAEELMKLSGINRKKLGRKWSLAIRVNPNIVDDSKPPATNKTQKSSEENEDQSSQSNDQLACIRVMCEHENEWHLSNTLAILPEPIATDYSAYLARIMRILKSGSLANDMQIFACEAGAKLLADIETKAVIDSGDGDAKLAASYTALRKFYIESYEAGKVACAWGRVDDDLSRCEMKNGKILWLCKRHVAETNARVLNNANKANQHLEVDLNSEMLNDLDQIEIEI